MTKSEINQHIRKAEEGRSFLETLLTGIEQLIGNNERVIDPVTREKYTEFREVLEKAVRKANGVVEHLRAETVPDQVGH